MLELKVSTKESSLCRGSDPLIDNDSAFASGVNTENIESKSKVRKATPIKNLLFISPFSFLSSGS